MALVLDLRSEQRDDGKQLTIWDTTEGWGTGGNDDVTDITRVTIKVEYHVYGNDYSTYTDYGTATFDYTAGDITAQSSLKFYIYSDESNLIVKDYVDSSEQTLSTTVYTDEILNDGIWRVTYTIYKGAYSEIDSQSFYYLLNYEDKVAVYEEGRALNDDYKLEELEYNSAVEQFLLRNAILKAEEYSAAAGQLEITEEIQQTLKNIMSDE